MLGPISSHPKALMDKNGSAKSSTTTYLCKQYKSTNLILNHLPWFPSSIILEGMFIIQTSPLYTMQTMEDYSKMLLNIYVGLHFHVGALVVHIVFDNPSGLPESPKQFEQTRRDTVSLCNHREFGTTTPIPQNWRDTLGCRKCKSALTAYLGGEFLRLAQTAA